MYSHDLQPISLVVHDAQVYVVKYEDFWTKTTWNRHIYLSKSINLRFKTLWEECIDFDDSYFGEKFKMCVMLFCVIHDFPAYGNLDGYSVKGQKACHICESNTCFHELELAKKIVYLGHQKFRKPNHPYCRLRKAFNGEHEFEIAHKYLTDHAFYQ